MILTADGIIKQYKQKKVLDGVSFNVNEGEIYAVLGKNGAGKSTFIKIALGLIFPSGGNISVYGNKPGVNNKRIGYLSENITLYPHLSARDNLKTAAYSTGSKISGNELTKILEKISLGETGNKPTKDFSLGMKRRLQFAMAAMIKKADFLILDEPTNGLDVNGMLWLKDYLNELKKDGVSILLASHAIFDLQECITDYVVFHNGTIARQGEWNKEKEMIQQIEITVLSGQMDAVTELLKANQVVIDSVDGGTLTVRADKEYKELCELLYKNGFFPERLEIVKNSLEKIFLNTVQENS